MRNHFDTVEFQSSSFDPMNSPKYSGRIKMALDLAIKLNDTYLKSTDINEILQAVLVGVTAGEGLGFNRAILVRINDRGRVLQGEYGVGPADKEEAYKIWTDINRYGWSLFEILNGVKDKVKDDSHPINQLAKKIVVPIEDKQHILVRSLIDKRAILVDISNNQDNYLSEVELSSLLGTKQFAIAPLISGDIAYGLIIADNFISKNPIYTEDVEALELFASLASIGLGKAYMCAQLQDRLAELERLYEDLERNKDLLIEAERYTALGRMADQLLHEIRNPLSALGGIARILTKKAIDPTVRSYANIIVKETTRLERIVNKLFDFTCSPVLTLKPVGLYGLIREVVSLLSSDFEKQNVKIHLDLPEPEPILNLDSIHIRQVFLNILKNSLDAMPDGGEIFIEVTKREIENNKCINICIKDTGPGLPPGFTLKAMEPFFTTKPYGMGLGLNLAKRIIEMHYGTFCLSCNKDKGVEVLITLPLYDKSNSPNQWC